MKVQYQLGRDRGLARTIRRRCRLVEVRGHCAVSSGDLADWIAFGSGHADNGIDRCASVEAIEPDHRQRRDSTTAGALALSLGIVRRVSVGVCERLAVPLLVGVVRPLILLPPAAICGWSVDQLEMVLLHELAHLRRWDNLINILQRVVESLLFFHPVVWWLTGWLRLERELCCDRLVVCRTGRPIAYAEMLVALVGSSHQGRTAALAMADRQVLTRIRRLLNFEDRSMKLTMPEGFGLLAALIVGALLAVGLSAARADGNGESKDSIRRVLETAARAVVALPRTATEYDFTVDTLANIARRR